MEAVCPKCQMRYEVSEELLQQGGPVVCPTCQVSLTLVQPGTNIPLEPPLPEASEAEGPSGPGQGWGAGSLLWGGSSPPEEPPPEEPLPEEPPPTEEALPEAAQAEQPAAAPSVSTFATPTWGTETQPAEQAVAPPHEAPQQPDEPTPQVEPAEQVEPAPQAAPAQPGASGPGTEDWASAAARWAASGFSSDNMPTFVKSKDAGDTAEPPEPVASAHESLPEVEPYQPSPESPDQAQLDQQAQVSEPAAPPPLPKPGIVLPTPQNPPPLDGHRSSTYVMRGSGEGVPDGGTPWSQAAGRSDAPSPAQSAAVSSPASEASDSLQIKLPTTGFAEPDALPSEKPAPVPVAKPSRTGLWIFLVLVVVAAGIGAAWWFVNQSKVLDEDKTETPLKADDAGVNSGAAANVGSDAGEDSSAKEDAGTGVAAKAQADKRRVGDAGTAKVGKKPDGGKSPARKKKIVAHNKPASDPQKALAHYKQGNVLIRKGRFKEAVREFINAIKADPRLALAHRGLGIAFAQLRRNKAACREYRAYSKMIPKDSKEMPALKQILKSCK